MKKTLAAVLAAAMALSTATVAFATDTASDLVFVDATTGTGSEPGTTNAIMGDTTKATIAVAGGTGEVIGEYLNDGDIKISVTVTSGRSYLAAAPSVVVTEKGDNHYAVLKFKIAHTYGTSSVKVGMKVRITALKDGVEIGGVQMNKGDTLTGDETVFKAAYSGLTAYGEDMTLTLSEVDDNCVLAESEELYDAADENGKVTIYFDNFAAFTAKISASQKDNNLYYTVDEVEDVTSAYPDVDFEFITFKGAPSFSNSGTMTFNAIGGKNTTVYTYADGELTELDSEYDSTYGIVTVGGIKKLGTFVIASEALEVEEEPAAPSTPAVEEANPNTGAC